MGGHDSSYTRCNGFPKRNQLHIVQALAIMGHDGKSVVRVNGCVAVPGEMFGHGSHVLLVSTDRRRSMPGHILGSLTKRTYPYHGVFRVIVHIHNGGQVHIDPSSSEFSAGDLAHPFGEDLAARGS